MPTDPSERSSEKAEDLALKVCVGDFCIQENGIKLIVIVKVNMPGFLF